jgi:hypothetical protein
VQASRRVKPPRGHLGVAFPHLGHPRPVPRRRRIAWDTADVRDGTLTVKLDGRSARKWSEHLDAVLRRLAAHGGGGREVEVSGRTITVEGVTPGCEDEVHHFLESAVHQVNADLAPEGEEDEDASGDDEERSTPDGRMTEAFRAFASRDERSM